MKIAKLYSLESRPVVSNEDGMTGDKVLPIVNEAEVEQPVADEVVNDDAPVDMDELVQEGETGELMDAMESFRNLQKMVKEERASLESNPTALKFATFSYHQTLKSIGLENHISMESIHDVASLEAGLIKAIKKTWDGIKASAGKIMQRIKDFKSGIIKESRAASDLIKAKIAELGDSDVEYTFLAPVEPKYLPEAISASRDFMIATGNLKLKASSELMNRLKSKDLKDTWDTYGFSDECIGWCREFYTGLPGADKEFLTKWNGVLGPFFFGQVVVDESAILGFAISSSMSKRAKENTYTAKVSDIVAYLKQIEEVILTSREQIMPYKALDTWMDSIEEVRNAIRRAGKVTDEFVDELRRGVSIVQYIIDHTAGMSALRYCIDRAEEFANSIQPVSK